VNDPKRSRCNCTEAQAFRTFATLIATAAITFFACYLLSEITNNRAFVTLGPLLLVGTIVWFLITRRATPA
jgi:hypothetical protein